MYQIIFSLPVFSIITYPITSTILFLGVSVGLVKLHDRGHENITELYITAATRSQKQLGKYLSIEILPVSIGIMLVLFEETSLQQNARNNFF
jgi:hypothetical protein